MSDKHGRRMIEQNRITCPCGCNVYGAPRPKAWKDGLVHVRQCGRGPTATKSCRHCDGARVKRRANSRERRVMSRLGGQRNPGSGAWGGNDNLPGSTVCEIEETAGEATVRGLRRWWLGKGVQAKTRKIRESKLRPGALVASWDGKPRLAVLTFDAFVDLCRLAEHAEGGYLLRPHVDKIASELEMLRGKLR